MSANRGILLAETDYEVIATVNGHEIPRSRFAELLIRSRGVPVLEQLIGLETARQAAEARGIRVSEAEFNREMNLSLRRLMDPLWSVAPREFDRAAAEQLLDTMLAQRSMSREEFELLTRRNAYLRKLAAEDVTITQGDLEREYAVNFGPSVEVRHIQVASAAEAARIRDLAETGQNFATLATRFSANAASAGDGGLLAPFSLSDERVPDAFRSAVSLLEAGQVSGVVRVGEWHHLICLERRIPAETVSFGEIRDRVEESLRDRIAEARMFTQFERLLKNATIAIHDPLLSREFDAVHKARGP